MMVIRKYFVSVVVFCAKTTNARGTVGWSGLLLPGDPASRPAVIRDVYTFWLRMPALPGEHCCTGVVPSKTLVFEVPAAGM